MSDGDVSVKVCVRVRPQSPREIIDCCRICTSFVPGEPQIILGSDKAFTYDKVFEMESAQRDIFKEVIEQHVDSCFEGLNSTILAYGQTGSGKTYTMGTQFDECLKENQRGLIPRAVDHMFDNMYKLKLEAAENGQPSPEFNVTAQFMEIYNEEILDLLSPSGEPKGKKSNLKIHEDINGEIYVDGMSTQIVKNSEEVLMCLQHGALSRTTASTEMNATSSRSHALFSLKIHIMRAAKKTEEEAADPNYVQEFENLTAKLVFVDLAGSERLKRTGATGERAKEGISINGGLLALGNVISALGDEKRKVSHVPYRDSKLTRLLQDSLGGNSQTLMVACISPTDRDFMETLNTLKYANRAKNIKNKVVVNQDKTSRMINMLREENMRLQQELMEYKMGQRTGEDGHNTDLFTENTMLRTDNDKLRLRLKALKEAQDNKDEAIAELRASAVCSEFVGSGQTDMSEMVQQYCKEIESLRTQLMEQQTIANSPQKQYMPRRPHTGRQSLNNSTPVLDNSIDEVLREAKCDLEKTMAKRSRLENAKDLEQTKIDDNKENLLILDEEEDEEEEMECDEIIDLEEKDEEKVIDDEDEDEDELIQANKRRDMEENLADIASEITIKQKLVEELEKSQKKIMNMKLQYEEKLGLLQAQIVITGEERDKVLLNLKQKGDSNRTKEEIKSTSDRYGKKLKTMEAEMKRLQTAQREHDKLVRMNKDNTKSMKNLQSEITQMKKNRCKLMRQIREETAKAKKAEAKKQQEILRLQRDKQKQVGQIKNLQIEQKRKDLVLKRKQEEINMMRKQKHNILNKKTPNIRRGPGIMRSQHIFEETVEERHSRRLSSQYSSFSARQKWTQIERRISDNIIRKHTVSQMEAEMDRLVKDRERLGHDLDEFIKAKGSALKAKDPNMDELQELDENIEGLTMQLDYLQDNIGEHQNDIVEMMEGREGGDTLEVQDIIDSSSLSDSKYLLEHFLSFTTNKGLAAAQSNTKVKDLEAQVKGLHQALERTEQRILEEFNNKEEETVHVNETIIPNITCTPSRLGKFFPDPKASDSPPIKIERSLIPDIDNKKSSRRRTAAPAELTPSLGLMASGSLSPMSGSLSSLDSELMPPPPAGMKRSEKGDLSNPSSPSLERKESVRRKTGSTGECVFDRLHSTSPEERRQDGHIMSVESDTRDQKLSCVSIVKGHTHGVQSISVHGNVLITGSTDRSIKMWDLQLNKEVKQAYFPDDLVKKVVYSSEQSTVYALTSQCLKAWDVRTDPKTCRSTQLTEFPSALLYPPGSSYIYFSTGISVRSWNIGQWVQAGVLHGHSGHVMCMEYVALEDKKYIVTGSRDHFCKLFDATDGVVSSRVATATLNPPHFDGVEAIVWANDHVYSGGRDANIKKWHIKTKKEKGAQRSAHKDRVQALVHVKSAGAIASGSRNGTVKLWKEEGFGYNKGDQGQPLIEINAHPNSSVTDLVYQDRRLFTSSGDTTVKIWAVN